MPRIQFTAVLEKFAQKGEKTSWTYVLIQHDLVQKLNPGIKKEYKVKGRIDALQIEQTSVMPMGDGNFILPINAEKRKALKKAKGDKVTVALEVDTTEFVFDTDFISCLNDETDALLFFKTLTASHQKYFSKWISSAKTDTTKAKRIAMAIVALCNQQAYNEMLRANKGM